VRLVKEFAERYAAQICGRRGLESKRLTRAAVEWVMEMDPARLVNGAVSQSWLEVQLRAEMRRARVVGLSK
jgi:hypothetical protein